MAPDTVVQRDLVLVKDVDDLDYMDRPVTVQNAVFESFSDGVVETGYQAIVDNETLDTYYVGRNYSILQNKDINSLVRHMIREFDMDLHSAFFDRGRSTWELVKPDCSVPFRVGEKDMNTEFRMRIQNSYTGGQSFQAEMGGLVTYCQNLFGMPTSYAKNGVGYMVRQKHTASIEKVTEKMMEQIPVFMETYKTHVEGKVWNSRPEGKITEDLKKLFPDTKLGQHRVMTAAMLARSDEKWGAADFNWFMALTNMTSFPEKYGLAESHIEKLEKYHATFLEN